MARRRPKLLIASSTEGLTYAKALKALLAPEIESEVWVEGFFAAGEFTLETLEERSSEYDGALVVATADDQVISRSRESPAPRDNLVFEFGLFVAIFGRRRALLLVEEKSGVRMPSDVSGLTYIPFQRTSPVDEGLKAAGVAVRQLANRWKDSLLDKGTKATVERLLRLSRDEVQDRSGITAEFGLHVFLVDERRDPPELVRVARERIGPKSPRSQSFRRGEGIIGTCWATEEPVFADFSVGILRDADKDAWDGFSERERFGMSWELLTISRDRYTGVGAVPITSFRQEPGFVGCVAYNLGRHSSVDPQVLEQLKVIRVFDFIAEAMTIVLDRAD
ncbi:MAG: nucleotide-binding protein [Proteobacteria bacterium]|nr:nucleotide-binding protein [Pseudomonadota bacterium]